MFSAKRGLKDYTTVRVLLQPFLLDALILGRSYAGRIRPRASVNLLFLRATVALREPDPLQEAEWP